MFSFWQQKDILVGLFLFYFLFSFPNNWFFFVGKYWITSIWIIHKCWQRAKLFLLLLVSFKERSGGYIYIYKMSSHWFFFCNISFCCVYFPFIMRFHQLQRLWPTLIRKLLCKQVLKQSRQFRMSSFKNSLSEPVVNVKGYFKCQGLLTK